MTTTPQSFEVSPPSPLAPMSMIILAAVVPTGFILATLSRSPARAFSSYGITVPIAFVILLTIALLLLMRWRAVSVQDGTLTVRATFYKKEVRANDIDFSRARVVNLEERTELRPSWKSNGYSTFGFDAGHFQARNGLGKIFCLLTQRERVLWLPLLDGKQHILLSLERPQAALDALRASAR